MGASWFLSATVALLLLLSTHVASFGQLCDQQQQKNDYAFPNSAGSQVPANLKVAFIGDSGIGDTQIAVLNQIKTWGAAFVVHVGDFDYDNNPAQFEANIDSVLGPTYPYFAAIGNHDLIAWRGHKERLQARIDRIGASQNCTGDVGVKMTCNWHGMHMVFSGMGVWGTDHVEYMDASFAASDSVWKVAAWHKNQRLMQIGGKFNGVGWGVYDTARKYGAIVATGHEHSFCRSYMMSDYSNQVVANFNETLDMKIGESFVFVSGLGGRGIREWNDRLIKNEWWAAYGASDNGIDNGSLLCTFHIDNNPRKAHCTLLDISGVVWDDFDLYTSLPGTMEEHKEAIAEFERTQSPCHQAWIEVPVSADAADAVEDAETGKVTCKHESISFKNKGVASLRFDNVPLKKGARIQHAYLQVYGSETDDQPQRFVITGSKGKKVHCGRAADSFQVANSQATDAFVVWDEEDEDWELNTVWVTPDLKSIVDEYVNADDWEEGNSITLNIAGQGAVAFYTHDFSPCFAPTLVFELEEEC